MAVLKGFKKSTSLTLDVHICMTGSRAILVFRLHHVVSLLGDMKACGRLVVVACDSVGFRVGHLFPIDIPGELGLGHRFNDNIEAETLSLNNSLRLQFSCESRRPVLTPCQLQYV